MAVKESVEIASWQAHTSLQFDNLIRSSVITQIHQKVVEIHRLSINRLLIGKTRARAWMAFENVPHLRGSVRGIRCRAETFSRYKQCHSSRALLLCTVLVPVMYQLDIPIVRSSFP